MRKLSIIAFAWKKSILSFTIALTFGMEAIGQNASYNANTIPIGGSNSTGFGWEALISNSGVNNTAFGFETLYNNTTGADNTAIGNNALFSNTTGIYCDQETKVVETTD